MAEVSEKNNLNHFRYYIKTRFKSTKRLFNLFNVIGGLSFVAIWTLYIILMFIGITGLPTILRSANVTNFVDESANIETGYIYSVRQKLLKTKVAITEQVLNTSMLLP